MKYLIILTAIFLFSVSTSAQPSRWEITTGTTFEVQSNSDFCVDSLKNLGGTLIFNGTKCGLILGISSTQAEIPKEFRLYSNYPNPFNPVTTIKFDIPKPTMVKLTIYDILGRDISRPIEERLEAGRYILSFDASELTSGTYFYRIEAGEFKDIKKMVLLK